MAKRGLCIGINYRNTEFELRGCLNDADAWAHLLASQKFDVASLVESQATRDNIIYAVRTMVTDLKNGDTGCITYSGHGSWVPDIHGDEPDGRDEAICPIDMGEDGKNLIIDDELNAAFGLLDKGARLVFVTDCCHSGSVFRFMRPGLTKRRVRFIPPSHFLHESVLYAKMERAFGVPRGPSNKALPGVIHFSGCKDNEYSIDAEIDDKATGAFTFFAIKAFEAVLAVGGTYQDVWRKIRENLPSWDFQQTPLLNAVTTLKKAKALD